MTRKTKKQKLLIARRRESVKTVHNIDSSEVTTLPTQTSIPSYTLTPEETKYKGYFTQDLSKSLIFISTILVLEIVAYFVIHRMDLLK